MGAWALLEWDLAWDGATRVIFCLVRLIDV